MEIPVYEWDFVRQNPLTREEYKNAMAEAEIHKKIDKPYYKGMGEGMEDIAEQYRSTGRIGYVLTPKYGKRGENTILWDKDRAVKEAADRNMNIETFVMNPVRIRKLPGQKKYRVYEGSRIASFGTTRKKAQAQARLLRGVKHGMVPRGNPPETLIYTGCIEMLCTKEGMKHYCDAQCKAARHRYKHIFKTKPVVVGLPDGRLLLEPK